LTSLEAPNIIHIENDSQNYSASNYLQSIIESNLPRNIIPVTQTVVAYFFYSLGLLFREGMEAMLVIVALAAGTRGGAGRIGRSRDIYAGAGAAIVASIVLAWAVNHLISDDASDTLEGVFQIFAAATLFYVSSWLTSKGQSDRWLKFINHKLESAQRSTIPGIALGLTAFLAVMREGAETIVFFQALTSGATEAAERHAVAAGVIVAAFALAIAFVVIRRAADRIPIGIFFHATSVLLYAMAIVFIGQGVASLQEASIIPATFVDYAPTIPMLGLFPTVQSLGAQALLLLLAAAAVFVPRSSTARQVRVTEGAAARARGGQA
jgi:high-affinity iron transporter